MRYHIKREGLDGPREGCFRIILDSCVGNWTWYSPIYSVIKLVLYFELKRFRHQGVWQIKAQTIHVSHESGPENEGEYRCRSKPVR